MIRDYASTTAVLAVMLLVLLATQGCGNSSSSNYGATSSTSTTGTTAAAVQEVDCSTVTPDRTVTISGSSFAPASVTISVNNIIKWTNNDGITHTVTGGTPGAPDNKFDTSLGSSVSKCLRFTSAGTYAYYCRIHTSMTGAVTVQ